MENDLIGPREIAETIFRVTERTLYHWRQKYGFPQPRAARPIRYSRAEVMRWRAKQRRVAKEAGIPVPGAK